MPKLPTYTAQIGEAPISGGRRASAEDFDRFGGLGSVGRVVQNAASSLMSEYEEQEARKALVESTRIRAEYNRKLDEAALSGADPDKIKQDMLNDLAKVGSEFQTKRGEDSLGLYTANAEITFDNEAARMKVERAAAEAKLDGHKFLTSASANIQRDPSSLKNEEAAADALAQSFTRIPAQQRKLIADGLKKDLNMAAAVASSRVDPEGTKKKLEDGAWDLTPEQRNIALNKADTEIRAKRADEAYQRAEKERQREELDATARDDHFAAIMKGTASQRAIMDDARLKPATREHMIALMEARAKAGAAAERRSDPKVKLDLWKRINAPEGSPEKIYNADAVFAAVQAGTLNTTDADYLNNQVAAQRDASGAKFGQRLNQRMMIINRALNESAEFKNQPELNAAIQQSLVTQVEQEAARLRKTNKSPDDLLNPDSKDYFFKPGLLKATAAAVKQQAVDELKKGATRVNSTEELLAVPDGGLFIDSSGTVKQMTPAVRAKAAPKKQSLGPTTVTGQISNIQAP